MEKWSVPDVTAFYEARDAVALGNVLAASSVNGSDLLELNEQSLHEDLRLSHFGARKLCKLRDTFLAN